MKIRLSIAEVRLRSPFIVCPKTSSDGLNLRDSWNNSCAANNSRWIPLSSLSQFPSSRYSSCSLVFGYNLFNLYEDLLLTECHSSTSSTVSLNAWLINEVCIIYKNTILTEEQIKVHHDFFAEKDTTFTQKINTISAKPMALQEDRSRW